MALRWAPSGGRSFEDRASLDPKGATMARPLQITDDTIVKALAAGGEVTAGRAGRPVGDGPVHRGQAPRRPRSRGGGPAHPGRAGERRPGRRPLVERRPRGRQRRACRTRYRRLGHRRDGARGGGSRRGRRVGPAGPGGARDLGARLPGRPAGRGVRADARWARPSAGPRGRCPTPWRRWRHAARWSWSATSPAGTGSPADRRRSPYPAAGNPAGYGLPHFGVRAYPEVG